MTGNWRGTTCNQAASWASNSAPAQAGLLPQKQYFVKTWLASLSAVTHPAAQSAG
ncbi:MAG: hypothetical protein MUC60_04970 [Oscillatoria sp. Prado101]|jgi:hypothetical protein|nr:hypothetical protein [Oscillatoria sp. Prado101]